MLDSIEFYLSDSPSADGQTVSVSLCKMNCLNHFNFLVIGVVSGMKDFAKTALDEAILSISPTRRTVLILSYSASRYVKVMVPKYI